MSKRTIIAIAAIAALIAAVLFLRSGGDEKKSQSDDVAKNTKSKVTRIKGQPAQGLRDDNSQQQQVVVTDPDPDGELQLEGQVVDANMQGVPGAVVSISTNPGRKVTTDKAGNFTISKLIARRYRLTARADEGVGGPVTARLTDKSDPVILKLRPAATVRVKVVTVMGAPVANSTVELRGLSYETAMTDGEGFAAFTNTPSGRYRIAATAPGFAPTFSRVMVPRTKGVFEREVKLRKGAPVSGRVVDESGNPVAEAVVAFGSVSSWGMRAGRRDAFVTKKDGKFEFAALPSGSFRFRTRHPKFAPGSSDLIVLDGKTAKTGVEIVVETGGVIAGKVVDKAGEPVAYAQVRVSSGRWRRAGRRNATTDKDGAFEIAGLPRRGVRLAASHESASSEITEIDLEKKQKHTGLTITLELDGKIAGVVVDDAGEPIEGAQVTALPATGGRAAFRTIRMRGLSRELTDAGGRFVISGLPEGEYALSATRPGTTGGGGFRRMMRRMWRGGGDDDDTVKARVGASNVKVVLPQNGGIKGALVFDDGSKPKVYTVGVGFMSRTPYANGDGSFEMTDLPPGSYRLRVNGPEFQPQRMPEITVEPGKVKDLGKVTVKRGRHISGRVVTSTGEAVEGATITAGRFVMGDGSNTRAGRGGRGRGKTTTSDENGEFMLRGLGENQVNVVADHDGYGRSQAIALPAGKENGTGLQLVIAAPGSIAGTVMKNGAPAGRAIVMARAVSDAASFFRVMSGDDGKFRFDRLAPGQYSITVAEGWRGVRRGMRRMMQGGGSDDDQGTKVTVESAKTTTVSVDVPPPPDDDAPF